MNQTIELLKRHRSIRTFTDDPVPEEDLRRAVEAGQAASTSSAVQAYAVIRVSDPATRAALVPLTGGQEKVASAGAFLVLCGDLRRHRLAAQMHGTRHRDSLETFLVAAIDASLFAQNMAVALESLGYGICYIGALRNDLPEVDRLLGLPEGVLPLYGMCVGVPAEEPAARPRLGVESVLFNDRYPDDQTMIGHLRAYDAAYEQYTIKRGSPPRTWSAAMARLFSDPRRADLATYYTSKGASFS